MPKRSKPHSAPPVPVQLPLFAEAASLIRVRPERNDGASTGWRSGPTCSAAPCCSASGAASAPKAAAGSIRIPTRAPPSMPSPASQGGSAAAATRSGAYDQIARSQADQARHAGAAAAAGMALHTPTARGNISPPASATPSCAPPSRPTARCAPSA